MYSFNRTDTKGAERGGQRTNGFTLQPLQFSASVSPRSLGPGPRRLASRSEAGEHVKLNGGGQAYLNSKLARRQLRYDYTNRVLGLRVFTKAKCHNSFHANHVYRDPAQ